MKSVLIALAITGMLATGTAAATEKLARASGCMTCHAVDKKLIGPGFKEIAAKYRGDQDAEARLAQKVKAGSSRTWGTMAMPPNAHVKEADIKVLVHWILSQK